MTRERSSRRTRSGASQCADQRGVGTSPTSASSNTCATASEHHGRHLRHGWRWLLLVPGALRRHDRLRRLQHRRPRSRIGAAGQHPAVAECGVVGAPDEERGQIVKAYVVLRPGYSGDAGLTKTLQDYVKATIAPYKYPRAPSNMSHTAAHPDRQAATVRASPGRRRGFLPQARVVITIRLQQRRR